MMAQTIGAMAVLMLIEVHTPDGRAVTLSSHEIVSMHSHLPNKDNTLVTKAAQCVINTTDGKFLAVVEPCSDITAMIRQAEGQK